jgi:hypothetical protein
MNWAYYDISSLNATKILSVSILTWSSWKYTDYVNISIGNRTPKSLLVISNTKSFSMATSNIVVRVHYV